MEMLQDTSTPAVPNGSIQNWINVLVAIDRDLAQTAITEASAAGSNQTRSQSFGRPGSGDADTASGNFDKAIEDYRKAWNGVRVCN
jgi:hypothetical protein